MASPRREQDMEQTNFKKRLTQFFLLAFCLVLIAGAFWLQRTPKPAERTYHIMTSPAIKILISDGRTYVENTKIKTAPKGQKFFAPKEQNKDIFWLNWRAGWAEYRYKPFLAFKYLYAYARALYEGKTNIYPHEFLLLSLEIIDGLGAEVITKIPASAKTQKPAQKQVGYSPLTAKDRPLIVEVYNAAGKKGLALEATHYLRDMNERKLLSVDVLQYDNNPVEEETSKIIYYSDKESEILQLSSALRIHDIYKEKTASAYYDAKIILGKDFTTPK